MVEPDRAIAAVGLRAASEQTSRGGRRPSQGPIPGRAASQPGANAPCFAAELAGLFLLLLNRPIAANDDKTSRSTANDDQNELMHADISDHVKCAV